HPELGRYAAEHPRDAGWRAERKKRQRHRRYAVCDQQGRFHDGRIRREQSVIRQLQDLEGSRAPGAWLEVATLYPRVKSTEKVAFVKALRRLDASRRAAALLQKGAAEADLIAALTVLRV